MRKLRHLSHIRAGAELEPYYLGFALGFPIPTWKSITVSEKGLCELYRTRGLSSPFSSESSVL